MVLRRGTPCFGDQRAVNSACLVAVGSLPASMPILPGLHSVSSTAAPSLVPTTAPHVIIKHGHGGSRQPKWTAAALTVEHAVMATEKVLQATQQAVAHAKVEASREEAALVAEWHKDARGHGELWGFGVGVAGGIALFVALCILLQFVRWCCCCARDCACGLGSASVSPDYERVGDGYDDGECDDDQGGGGGGRIDLDTFEAPPGPALRTGTLQWRRSASGAGAVTAGAHGAGDGEWIETTAALYPMLLVLYERGDDNASDDRGSTVLHVAPLNETVTQLKPQPGKPHAFFVLNGAKGPVAVLSAPTNDDKFAWLEAISSASIGLWSGAGGACDSESDTHTIEGCLELLGLDESQSSLSDIKRAYHRLALNHHPDRGGDTAKFSRIAEANNVLKVYRQREAHDKLQYVVVSISLPRTSSGIGIELEDVGVAPLNRVTVSGFSPGSVAEADGRIAKGDIVLAVDGLAMRGKPLDAVFKTFMQGSREGKTSVDLEFLRDRDKNRKHIHDGADGPKSDCAEDSTRTSESEDGARGMGDDGAAGDDATCTFDTADDTVSHSADVIVDVDT